MLLGRESVYFPGSHTVHPLEEGTTSKSNPFQIVILGHSFKPNAYLPNNGQLKGVVELVLN